MPVGGQVPPVGPYGEFDLVFKLHIRPAGPLVFDECGAIQVPLANLHDGGGESQAGAETAVATTEIKWVVVTRNQRPGRHVSFDDHIQHRFQLIGGHFQPSPRVHHKGPLVHQVHTILHTQPHGILHTQVEGGEFDQLHAGVDLHDR